MSYRFCLPVLAILTLQASPAHAQATDNYGIAAIFGTARREDNRTGAKISRNGVSIGMEGHYTASPVTFEMRYVQSGMSDDQDLIEGELFAGVQPLSWLRVKAGRHIRAVILDDVTERWQTWELRVRTAGEVFAPSSQAYGVHTYGEFWLALAGSANISGDFGAGRGVEGGLFFRMTNSALFGRLAYRVDRSTISGGPRLENLQELSISIGWGR